MYMYKYIYNVYAYIYIYIYIYTYIYIYILTFKILITENHHIANLMVLFFATKPLFIKIKYLLVQFQTIYMQFIYQ